MKKIENDEVIIDFNKEITEDATVLTNLIPKKVIDTVKKILPQMTKAIGKNNMVILQNVRGDDKKLHTIFMIIDKSKLDKLEITKASVVKKGMIDDILSMLDLE